MAPTNKGKGIFKCREVTCSKTFTLIQNRSKHEKKFKHAPVTRRSSLLFHSIILIQKDTIAQ